MADSKPGSELSAALAPRVAQLATVDEELAVEPIEGLPHWLGSVLHRVLFRALSMIELPQRAMSGAITPIDGYFRRDRYSHPKVDPGSYRLEVSGVSKPRSFTLEELRALPTEQRVTVMECAGNGNHLMGSAGLVAQAHWAGPSLASIVEACGGPGSATHFAFHGLDRPWPLRPGYHYGLSLEELDKARALVAITMNGEPLPRQRGFPARLIVPGIYSMSHVKWLGRIVGKTEAHLGFYNRYVFVNKERRAGKWEKVEARWIGLKSLVTRCIRRGETWELTGWAWGGGRSIERVEVTTDGGETWVEAELQSPASLFPEQDLGPADLEWAWSVFSLRWAPPGPGKYRVASRATDAEGNVQPFAEDPNVKGHFDQCRIKWRRVRVPG